jgi:hypothetical protein
MKCWSPSRKFNAVKCWYHNCNPPTIAVSIGVRPPAESTIKTCNSNVREAESAPDTVDAHKDSPPVNDTTTTVHTMRCLTNMISVWYEWGFAWPLMRYDLSLNDYSASDRPKRFRPERLFAGTHIHHDTKRFLFWGASCASIRLISPQNHEVP